LWNASIAAKIGSADASAVAGKAAGKIARPANSARRDRPLAAVGIADEFKGGVLCTRLALVMGIASFVIEVRAEAEARNFPSAYNYVIIANGKIKL